MNVSDIKISKCFWLRDKGISINLKWGLLHRLLFHPLCSNAESLKQSVLLCFCQMKNNIWLPAAQKLNLCFHVTFLLVTCCVNMTNIVSLKYYNKLCVCISLKSFFTKFVLTSSASQYKKEHSEKTNVLYFILVSLSLVSETNCSMHK